MTTVILPSSNEIEGLNRLIDLVSDPAAVKKILADLKKAKKDADAAAEALSAKHIELDERQKAVSEIINGIGAREEAIAAREAKKDADLAEVAAAQAKLKADTEEYHRICTKDLPALMAGAKKAQAEYEKKQKALDKQIEAAAKTQAEAEAVKAEYGEKLAKLKTITG